MSEAVGYRDNLEDILEYFGGRRALSASDVGVCVLVLLIAIVIAKRYRVTK